MRRINKLPPDQLARADQRPSIDAGDFVFGLELSRLCRATWIDGTRNDVLGSASRVRRRVDANAGVGVCEATVALEGSCDEGDNMTGEHDSKRGTATEHSNDHADDPGLPGPPLLSGQSTRR